MKLIFSLVLSFVSVIAQAQIDLDHAYLGKKGNRFFYDSSVPNLVWAIPISLEASPNGVFVDLGARYKMGYTVSIPLEHKLELDVNMDIPEIEFRSFRATDFEFIPDIIDISDDLKPEITPMGDLGMFGETIPWSLSVIKGQKTNKNGTGALLIDENFAKTTLFNLFAGKHRFSLGRIHYFFSAVRGGQPYMAETSIGIFSEKYKHLNYSSEFSSPRVLRSLGNPEESEEFSPSIIFDSQKTCWGKPQNNVICLKD
jgi:hypothetical protein